MTNAEKYKDHLYSMLRAYDGFIDLPSPLGCVDSDHCEKNQCALFILAKMRGETINDTTGETICNCSDHWLKFDRDSEEGKKALSLAIEERKKAGQLI